jgi:hypothetical protein
VRLCRWFLVVPCIFVIVAQPAATPRDEAATPRSAVLQRFLALPDPAPEQVRALRHLEARNEHFDSTAWMDVWTELDRHGFRYTVIDEGGSEYIRNHVFRPTLTSECDVRASGGMERASFTTDNYVFADGGVQPDGTQSLVVKPRKKDVLFVEGSIFLSPDDGDLVRLEGRMSKSPSFWTRRVEVVRWFRRVAGFRMPVALESTANVLIAGRSSFRMTYEYETVNGQRVGEPQPQRRLSQLR